MSQLFVHSNPVQVGEVIKLKLTFADETGLEANVTLDLQNVPAVLNVIQQGYEEGKKKIVVARNVPVVDISKAKH